MWTGDLVADHNAWTSGHVTWSTSLCKPYWKLPTCMPTSLASFLLISFFFFGNFTDLNSYSGLVCVTCPQLPVVMLWLPLLGYPDEGKGGSLWAGLCAHSNFPAGISESFVAFQPQDPAQLSFRESPLPFSTRWFEILTHSPRGCTIPSQYLGKVHQPRGSLGYFSDGAECESHTFMLFFAIQFQGF